MLFVDSSLPSLSPSLSPSLCLSLMFVHQQLVPQQVDQHLQAHRGELQTKPSHGGNMALSVPADRHRGLHGGQVMSDPAVHGGSLRPSVRPDRRGGLLLPPGGDRAGQEDQAADLGHCWSGALQVSVCLELYNESAFNVVLFPLHLYGNII